MTTLATENIVNGLVRVTGSDAEKFLQGQLTCDMNELAKKRALPGAYCSAQGRVRASFIIFQIDKDDYLMILPKQQIAFLIDAMAPYIAFFQSTITDVSNEWHLFGILINQPADAPMLNNIPKLPKKIWEISTSETMYCIKLPGETSRWYCLSTQAVTDLIVNIPVMDALEWQIQDMKSGLVWIDENNRDKFLPHDLSLPALGAVSFSKGCYTGQEIVARMQYKGRPKYSLAVISTEPTDEDMPEKLTQLLDNSEELIVGNKVKQLHLTDNSWLILASVKRILINQQQFKLSSFEKAILCSITIPDIVKESNNL